MKENPDYHDADLVLRVYEMRREPIMRESRNAIGMHFWPKSFEDIIAITSKPDHSLNAPFRQVASYWEMVYGMPRHGIVHAEYFLETQGEGMFLYAKVAPFLERYRAEISPTAFRNAEWVATETQVGKRLFGMFTARVKKVLESR